MTKESGSAIYRLKQQGKNLFGLCPQGVPSEKEFCRMKEKKIMLPTVEIAKKFVADATKCDSDIDVFYNRVTIDAKSILGVLSLDLTKVLTVQYSGESKEFDAYLESISPEAFAVAA